MTAWVDVLNEHRRNVGFVEVGDNGNPWSEELGAGDVAYCISAATVVPHHHGVDWGGESQQPHKGWMYCPYALADAVTLGRAEYDASGSGRPAHIYPGDLLLWDWDGTGVADHCETATIEQHDGGYVTNIIGYNTGTPEGCHDGIARPRQFLLAVIHMGWAYEVEKPPVVVPPEPKPPTWLHAPKVYLQEGMHGQNVALLQHTLNYALHARLAIPKDPNHASFGPITKRAVYNFQKFMKLSPATGNYGPHTASTLQYVVDLHKKAA